MLSEEDRAILDFERLSLQQAGPKDQAIEMVLGLTAAAYYERLLEIVYSAPASAYDPLTTKRVRALVESPMEAGLAV
ncbi:MAG: DUF3263 domain-containing protein [Acidimicrobiia bacterium]